MLSRISFWVAIGALSALSGEAAWTPPADPKPETIEAIRAELGKDLAAKQYDDALAKHVWYHENALKYGTGQGGVRLSFVLSNWLELGKAYPPALQKLKAIQDGLEKQLSDGKGGFQQFHDFSAINKLLNEVKRTSDIFLLLDAKYPAQARIDFQAGLPALVTAKEYALCGKYLQPEQFYKSAADNFRYMLKFEAEHPAPGPAKSFAKQNFPNQCSTLVALLVKNNRLEEAKKFAAEGAKEFDDAAFKTQLEKALKGEVPPPWP
jgi:hypothetical protein